MTAGRIALLLITVSGLTASAQGQASPAGGSSSMPARAEMSRSSPVRIGAYWWDGWFEGSPYIRAPLITEFQDREPVWGWRDDRQEAVDSSIRFAARYGVNFFAFLWYPENAWHFPGGQPSGVMNGGLRFYLSSKAPERKDVGFLLMIVHAPEREQWEDACREWVRRYLMHERYVRVGGRPVMFFYELGELDRKLGGRERVRPALEMLRRIVREERRSDPFLVLRVQGKEGGELKALGFDGATDYACAWSASAGEHPYSDLVSRGQQVWKGYAGRRLNYIPSVTAGWDGRPRAWMEKPYYQYWYRRSPGEFGGFVRKGLDWIGGHPQDIPESPLLMIYAWNEADEGGAICPTKMDGAAYLNALREAVNSGQSAGGRN